MSPPAQLMSLGEATHESRREALAATFSLHNIAIESISGLVPLLPFYQRREDQEISSDVREWLDLLVTEVDRSRRNASEQLAQLDELIAQSRELEEGMGLRFLYDEERRIFAIGYQVAERRLDNSFYDLLASEARLTSFLAIARGEVPVEHWWALSRPFGSAYGRLPLLSWSGTMFEYLMPLLFTQTHENSLLDRACYDAVHCQIGYGRQNRVPWGISESAFSALDRHNVYQYRAFGVPALALKRGQEEDLVVAPYAAALALGVEPAAAMKNLRRLAFWTTQHCSANTATTKRSIIRDARNSTARRESSSTVTWFITRECRSWLMATPYMTTRCGGGFIPIPVFAPPSRSYTNISRNKFCRRPVRRMKNGPCGRQ